MLTPENEQTYTLVNN